MQDAVPKPVTALAPPPLDQNLQIEPQWLQNCLTWLKSAPPEARGERLRRLGVGVCSVAVAGYMRLELLPGLVPFCGSSN